MDSLKQLHSNITALFYSFLITSAGVCRAVFHTLQIIVKKIISAITKKTSIYHPPINRCLFHIYFEPILHEMIYPTEKATHDAMTSNIIYSLMNRFRIIPTLASCYFHQSSYLSVFLYQRIAHVTMT